MMTDASGVRGRRMHVGLWVACSAAAGLWAVPLHAEEARAVVTSPVVVTATRVEESSFEVPASIDALDSVQIQEGHQKINASEVLVRVPGVVVQNRQNYSQDFQISSRGFGARAAFGIRGLRLIADEIPASMPDGQGSAGMFSLSSAERIEVLRGPFSVLYGNHSGGVVRVVTQDGPPRPTVSASFDSGSFDTTRVGAQFGGTSGALNYIADGYRFETDGYRDHSAARKDHGNVKLRWQMGEDTKATLVANWLDQPENQDPLGLSAAQVAANPAQAAPEALEFNTRRSLSNRQMGLVLEHRLGADDTLSAVAYYGERTNDQFLALDRATQRRATQSGAVSVFDREFGGITGRWTHRGTLAGGAYTLTAGVDYEQMKDDRRGYENFFYTGGANIITSFTSVGTQGRLRRNEDNMAIATGEYLQARWDFLPRLSATAAVRHTKVRFSSDDHFICGVAGAPACPLGLTPGTNNPDDSGHADFEQTVPVLGLSFAATPAVNVYVNYGEGFETPTLTESTFRPDGTSGVNFELRPMRSQSWEAGVKALLGEWGRASVAVFNVDSEDEIVVATNSGGRQTFQNAGRTGRRGMEASIDAALGKGFSAYAAYAWLEAEYRDAFITCGPPPCAVPTVVVPAGNRLPSIPQSTFYAELVWRQPGGGFFAGLETYWQSKAFVDDLNREFADAYQLFNLRAGYDQRFGDWRFSLYGRVDNLADEDYIAAVSVNDSNGRFYHPGPDRSYTAGVTLGHSF